MNNNNRGNNNSNNNNRRRGRGNRPQGGGGGGQQLNRIDSRARGNAPQLLEKYRKLAQDAHLNGDRVTAEYYLQFADHYFRVLADQRARQDEQRVRRDDRSPEAGDEGEDNGEFTMESDFPSFEQPGSYSRREREDRPRREDRPERPDRPDRQDRDDGAERGDRADQGEVRGGDADGNGDSADDAAANPYEPPENPFVRENRGTRGLKPRREDRRPRREERSDDDAPAGLDPSSLPPAISIPRDTADEGEAEAKPRRRAVRRKPAADDAGETLESVS